jgi:release factor glutamine methyltransferase
MAHSIQNLYRNIVLKLKALNPDEEARAMADRLFEYYFNITPAQRIFSGTTPANQDKISLIEEAAGRLLNHVPLQYVLGTAYFMDMEFAVTPDVLIPRPETEELVSLIVKDLAKKKTTHKFRILDIGTGSGCIAISLKHFLPAAEVTAIDISNEALRLASANAVKNNVTVSFIHADIIDELQWESLPECDLIVSNPPYVTLSEKQFMQPNVLDYEPHTALFVPDDDPLIFYRTIIAFAEISLSEDGSLWFEINEQFGGELRNMALNQGFKEVNIIFDIRGKSRFLQCSKKKFY